MSRLHLRRIMYNPGNGDTSQTSDEDVKRTIISLQGGKTFGRGGGNDVVMLADHENIDKDSRPAHISRLHARFYHSTRDGVEQYQLEDKSENGTYLNDRRLPRAQKELLKSGDTIKFGHRNGANVLPGEEISSPDAEFAFSVEMPRDEQTYRLLDELKNSRIHVFSNSAFFRECGTRSDLPPTVVQQQEADSTEAEMGGAGDSARTTHNDQQMPSTSQTLSMNAPLRAPHSRQFTNDGLKNLVTFLYRTNQESAFRAKHDEDVTRVARLHPTIARELLEVVMSVNVIEGGANVADTTVTIEQVCRVLREYGAPKSMVDEVHRLRAQLAAAIHDPKLEKDREEEVVVLDNVVGSQNSAFHNVVVPTPVRVSNGNVEFLKKISLSDVEIANFTNVQQQRQQSAFNTPFLTSLQTSAFNSHFLQHYLSPIANLSYQSPFTTPAALAAAAATPSYLDPVRRAIDLQPVRPVAVIATAGTPAPLPPPPDKEPEQVPVEKETTTTTTTTDADEERHSASSTSSAHSRRRTESEDSEILDVVGTDEPRNVVPPPAEDVPESEDVAESTTPRIDGQSTSSAVVSALPTPISSPLPRPVATPVATPPPVVEEPVEKPVEKKKPEDRRQKMKQLDESSESDSDEQEEETTPTQKPQQKKKTLVIKKRVKRRRVVQRRSARNGGKKKEGEDVEEDVEEEEEEEEEDDGDDEGSPPKTRGRRPKATLKRTASQSGVVRRRKNKETAEVEEKEKEQEEEQEEPPKKRRGRKKAADKETDGDDAAPGPKDKCGVKQKYCISNRFEGKKDLQWVECQECNQWYHVFCVRLDNDPYLTTDSFSCCGPSPSYEATQAITGEVHARWLSFPGKRKVPK